MPVSDVLVPFSNNVHPKDITHFLLLYLFSVSVASTGWVNNKVSSGYAAISVRVGVRCWDKKSLLSFVAGSRVDSALIYTRQ